MSIFVISNLLSMSKYIIFLCKAIVSILLTLVLVMLVVFIIGAVAISVN